MSTKTPRRGAVSSISGSIVDDLNKLKPGLGTRLVREINQRIATINVQLDTQAGHRGTVTVAKQTRVSSTAGSSPPGIALQGDRVAGVAWAQQGDEAVPLDQFRSFLTCDFFLQMVEDCIDLPEQTGGVPNCFHS